MSLETLANNLLNIVRSADSTFNWLYILSCILISALVLISTRTASIKTLISTLFPKTIWLSKSAVTDVIVTILYMLFFNTPTSIVQIYLAVQSYYLVLSIPYTFAFTFALPPIWEGLVATLIVTLAFDLATYIGHRLMHEIPILWYIHAVHHSPEKLNFFSAYRQHPFDRLIRNSLGGIFTGVSLAVLHKLLPASHPGFVIMGVGAGTFLFMLTVHLQHSHIPIHYPRWLAILILSPHLHQIHHSADPKHFGKNFGGIFPYWDKMFGTLCDEKLEINQLNFGLPKDQDPYQHSVLRCYWYPLYAMLIRTLGRSPAK